MERREEEKLTLCVVLVTIVRSPRTLKFNVGKVEEYQ